MNAGQPSTDVLGFYLPTRVHLDDLAPVLAGVFGVGEDDLADLYDPGAASKAVRVEVAHYPTGLLTGVTLYVDKARMAAYKDDLELARALAPVLGQNVVVSPGDDQEPHNPFVWILVRPSGDAYWAWEREPEDGAVVIDDDPEHLEPMTRS